MNERKLLFRALATNHPRSYWVVISAILYGITSLLHDIAAGLGWGPPNSWPSRLLGAILTGGIFLWLERHASAKSARTH